MPKNKTNKPKLYSQAPQLGAIVLVVIGFMLGGWWSNHKSYSNAKNVVIVSDKNVKVPSGLVGFLKSQNSCQSQKTVGIWSIYQTSDSKFAKVAYGCGVSLESYIMAVKQKGKWQLLPTKDYFLPAKDAGSLTGYGPSCDMLAKYSITKAIEPVCVTKSGQSKVVN